MRSMGSIGRSHRSTRTPLENLARDSADVIAYRTLNNVPSAFKVRVLDAPVQHYVLRPNANTLQTMAQHPNATAASVC